MTKLWFFLLLLNLLCASAKVDSKIKCPSVIEGASTRGAKSQVEALPTCSSTEEDSLGMFGPVKDTVPIIGSKSSMRGLIRLAATNKHMRKVVENVFEDMFKCYNDREEMDKLVEENLIAKNVATRDKIRKAIPYYRSRRAAGAMPGLNSDETLANLLVKQEFPYASAVRNFLRLQGFHKDQLAPDAVTQAVDEARMMIKSKMGEFADFAKDYNDDDHMDKEISRQLKEMIKFKSFRDLLSYRKEMLHVFETLNVNGNSLGQSVDHMELHSGREMIPIDIIKETVDECRRRAKNAQINPADVDVRMAKMLKMLQPVLEKYQFKIDPEELVRNARSMVTSSYLFRIGGLEREERVARTEVTAFREAWEEKIDYQRGLLRENLLTESAEEVIHKYFDEFGYLWFCREAGLTE